MAKISDFGFDLGAYQASTSENVEMALKMLASFLGPLQVVISAFEDLRGSIPMTELENNLSRIARFHYSSHTSINLVKAMTNVLSGHFSDANIFSRKTLEAIRYSSFLRDHPEFAMLWTETAMDKRARDKFDGKFRNWLSYKGGKGEKKIGSEIPLYSEYWERLSNVGPHANFSLMSFQSEFVTVNGQLKFRTRYHEIESGEIGSAMLLQYYFVHITIHFAALDWWIQYSGLPFKPSLAQRDYWNHSAREHRKAFELHLPFLEKHLKPKQSSQN